MFIYALAVDQLTSQSQTDLVFSLRVFSLRSYQFAMAFMMPLVKNDYNIYPSCPSTRNGMGTPQSQSRGSSLSSSPTAASFISTRSSQSRSSVQTPNFGSSPKSGSQVSLHNFHSKLLDKLRKTFRGKDSISDDSSSSAAIR